MPVRDIITDPEKISNICDPVRDIEFRDEVVRDLIDTAKHWQTKPNGCLGLAANQIGCNARIFVIWFENRFMPMISPEVVYIKGNQDSKKETCLSRPGVQTKVRRHKKIQVTYQDEIGNDIVAKFTGYTARVIQHELGHLNGVCI